MVTYVNRVFPHEVGGAGPYETVTLTLTGGDATALADLKAYNEADATAKGKHDFFSDIVLFFHRYGAPISVKSPSATSIELKYEWNGLHVDSNLGKPPFFSRYNLSERPSAQDICDEYKTMNAARDTPFTLSDLDAVVS